MGPDFSSATSSPSSSAAETSILSQDVEKGFGTAGDGVAVSVSSSVVASHSPHDVTHGCGSAIPLYHRDAAPDYLTMNPFIKSGYRVSLSYPESLKSAFVWTNETVNIWTHMLPILYMVFELVRINSVYSPLPPVATYDLLSVSAFLGASLLCLVFSTFYHMFLSHSPAVCYFWFRLDIYGIMLVIWVGYTMGFQCAFGCFPYWQHMYRDLSIFLTIITSPVPFHPRFLDAEKQGLRLALLIVFIAVGVVPAAHWVVLHNGFSHPEVSLFFTNIAMMWFLLGFGIYVYASKTPEKYWPGAVDYIGSSHQLWHVIVTMAMVYWYHSGVDMAVYRHGHPCTATGSHDDSLTLPAS